MRRNFKMNLRNVGRCEPIPCSRVLPEKLTVTHVVKKFLTLYGN
jgi:hypothetical protein